MMRSSVRLAVSIVGFIAVAALADAQPVGPRNPNTTPVLGSSVRPPATFGTTQYSVTSVFAGSFTAFDTSHVITSNINYYRYFADSTISHVFLGSVSIPEGVVIDFIGVNNCDPVGGSYNFELFDDTTGSNYNLIGQVTTPLNSCEVDYNGGSALGYQYPMNAGHNLEIAISSVVGVPTDGSAGVQSVEVWWRRQVSPAPATADFTDVPTSNPQFQFVEALYQAGITAGCGGGNFCPDNPVTRGQMAVFLAKALGLNWPETPVP